MAKAARNAAWALAIVVLGGTTAAGQSESRLRPSTARIADLIRVGTSNSPTFMRLVDAIERSDGLVYLSEGACGVRVRACLVMQLDQAGPSRMLRIRVTVNGRDDDAIVSIGHELQHVMEVLGDPGVRNTEDMFVLYQRIGLNPSSSWLQGRTRFRFETTAAIATGDAIREEMRLGRTKGR